MSALPEIGALLVRTDFTDDSAWEQVQDEATREYGPDGFTASVAPVSDPGWAGATWEEVKAAAPAGETGPTVLFLADGVTFGSPEHPVLVVDLLDKILSVTEFPHIAGRVPFRCISSAVWAVENNLSISNLDWEDFTGPAEDDGGIYRGLELPPLSAQEKAAAARQARLAEELDYEQARLDAELGYWAGRLPSDRIRATAGNARAMARLDVDLADAIAAAGPGVQQSVARWAARRAYEVAGLDGLDWVAPALAAADDGQELPPPFDDHQATWRRMHSDPRVPRTTAVTVDGRVPNLLRAAAAIPALFAAVEPDPLDAALQALWAAAHAFGREDYPAFFQEARNAFHL